MSEEKAETKKPTPEPEQETPREGAPVTLKNTFEPTSVTKPDVSH
jgi:hypothetical protein